MEAVIYPFRNLLGQLFRNHPVEDKVLIENVCNDLSFQFIGEDGHTALVIPFMDNMTNYLWHYLGIETLKVLQAYCDEKIKRLNLKHQTGELIYIRRYLPPMETVNDFEYVRIKDLREPYGGNPVFEFENGPETAASLKQEADNCFSKINDWKVYEDLVVWEIPFVLEKENIIKKYKDLIIARAVNHPLNGFEFEKYGEVVVAPPFAIYRKKAYHFLRGLFPEYSKELIDITQSIEMISDIKMKMKDFKCFLLKEKSLLKEFIR